MPLNVNQFLDRTSAANRNALNSGRSNIFPGPQKGLQGIPVSSQFALDRRKGRFGSSMGIFGPTVQSFAIDLDSDHVLSGQQLSGKVKLNITKGTLKARNVKLIITGQCNIKYTQKKV